VRYSPANRFIPTSNRSFEVGSQLFRHFFKVHPSLASCRFSVQKNIGNAKRFHPSIPWRITKGRSLDAGSALSISPVKRLRRLIESVLLLMHATRREVFR